MIGDTSGDLNKYSNAELKSLLLQRFSVEGGRAKSLFMRISKPLTKEEKEEEGEEEEEEEEEGS